MLTVKDCLTYHGKSLDQCQWVIDNFKNHPLYQDNEGVQVWVKASDEKEGPIQSHNPEERVWEYDDDGTKIYKANQGYNRKTVYTKEHYYGTHFWKNRQ